MATNPFTGGGISGGVLGAGGTPNNGGGKDDSKGGSVPAGTQPPGSSGTFSFTGGSKASGGASGGGNVVIGGGISGGSSQLSSPKIPTQQYQQDTSLKKFEQSPGEAPPQNQFLSKIQPSQVQAQARMADQQQMAAALGLGTTGVPADVSSRYAESQAFREKRAAQVEAGAKGTDVSYPSGVKSPLYSENVSTAMLKGGSVFIGGVGGYEFKVPPTPTSQLQAPSASNPLFTVGASQYQPSPMMPKQSIVDVQVPQPFGFVSGLDVSGRGKPVTMRETGIVIRETTSQPFGISQSVHGGFQPPVITQTVLIKDMGFATVEKSRDTAWSNYAKDQLKLQEEAAKPPTEKTMFERTEEKIGAFSGVAVPFLAGLVQPRNIETGKTTMAGTFVAETALSAPLSVFRAQQSIVDVADMRAQPMFYKGQRDEYTTRFKAQAGKAANETGTTALVFGAFTIAGRGIPIVRASVRELGVKGGVAQSVKGAVLESTTGEAIGARGISSLDIGGIEVTPVKQSISLSEVSPIVGKGTQTTSTGYIITKGTLETKIGGRTITGFNLPVGGTVGYRGDVVPTSLLPKNVPNAISGMDFKVGGDLRVYGTMGEGKVEFATGRTYTNIPIKSEMSVLLGKGTPSGAGLTYYPQYVYEGGKPVRTQYFGIAAVRGETQSIPLPARSYMDVKRLDEGVITKFKAGGMMGEQITSKGFTVSSASGPTTDKGVAIYGGLFSQKGLRQTGDVRIFFEGQDVKMFNLKGSAGGDALAYQQAYITGYKSGTRTGYVTEFKTVMKTQEQEFSQASLTGLKTVNIPTQVPTQVPIRISITIPTQTPFQLPTQIPTQIPFQIPTQVPTQIPTQLPTQIPTQIPFQIPTQIPTQIPFQIPTQIPTQIPRQIPTQIPTQIPFQIPTQIPFQIPTQVPFDIPRQPPPPPMWFPTGMFGGDMSGGFEFGKKTKKEKGKYSPSFIAVTLGIRGKPGKSEMTGFAIRPMALAGKKKKR